MGEKEERRFGKCPVCKQDNKWLFFALGMKKGNLWCNWICHECYKMLRDKEVVE